MSGAVVVSTISNYAEPHICILMGAVGGVVFSILSRIYSRFKVLTGQHSIIFGAMTIVGQVSVGLFSKKNGMLTTNS